MAFVFLDAEMRGPKLTPGRSLQSNGNKIAANAMLSRSNDQARAFVGLMLNTKTKG